MRTAKTLNATANIRVLLTLPLLVLAPIAKINLYKLYFTCQLYMLIQLMQLVLVYKVPQPRLMFGLN